MKCAPIIRDIIYVVEIRLTGKLITITLNKNLMKTMKSNIQFLQFLFFSGKIQACFVTDLQMHKNIENGSNGYKMQLYSTQ